MELSKQDIEFGSINGQFPPQHCRFFCEKPTFVLTGQSKVYDRQLFELVEVDKWLQPKSFLHNPVIFGATKPSHHLWSTAPTWSF